MKRIFAALLIGVLLLAALPLGAITAYAAENGIEYRIIDRVGSGDGSGRIQR